MGKIWREIICLGDSLTYGARDEFGRSYTHELSRILSEDSKELWVCHNYGVNGETSSDLIRRTWKILLSHQKCSIVNLLIGTNDIKIPTPVNLFESNINHLVGMCNAHNKKVLIGTIPPIKFSPAYMDNKEYIVKYNNIILNISKKLNCELVNFDSLQDKLIDGVHFSNDGNCEIAKIWMKAIKKL